MTMIKAIVRNGQIEVEKPVDLPDGTELTIRLPDLPVGSDGADESEPPEAIDGWLRWYDSLEPLEFTQDERAAWEAARREQKEFELAQWEKSSRGIENQFP